MFFRLLPRLENKIRSLAESIHVDEVLTKKIRDESTTILAKDNFVASVARMILQNKHPRAVLKILNAESWLAKTVCDVDKLLMAFEENLYDFLCPYLSTD